ncbi:MAG: histidine phosphatase family protein [Ideonella sp.]|nr:histidine phosphatase family protein [Ideonella sp.]
MQVTRLLAIRHGETAWNAKGRIQGHLDIPLSEVGLGQARRLAHALATEPLAAIYTSDLARARETAAPLAARLGLEARPDPRLRERGFGCFEGMTFPEIEARWPEDHRRWRERDPAYGPPDGEVLADFYDRVVAAAAALCEAHRGEAVALVAHGGVLDCLYRAATRVDLRATRTWALANASINRLLHTPDGFTLVGWGDTLHLDDPALDEAAESSAPGASA